MKLTNKLQLIWLWLLVINQLLPISLHGQIYRIQGVVLDEASQESLNGCHIVGLDQELSVLTDQDGRFTITQAEKDALPRVIVSYLGYQRDTVLLQRDAINIIYLKSLEIELTEIEIKDTRPSVSRHEANQFDILQVQKIPSLVGETDVLTPFRFLPGITGGSEGQVGLYVRGGTPDQNLILLDGVPIYYAYHLGGFSSTFSPWYVKNVTLYNNFIPASYTGRLSSVLDVRSFDGSREGWKKHLTIGMLSSSFSVSGPVGKKVSVLASLRRAPYDLLLSAYSKWINKEEIGVGYYFIDGLVKVNYRLNPRSEINIAYFQSLDKSFIKNSSDNEEDDLYFDGAVQSSWGNQVFSVHWKRIGDKWLSNVQFSHGKFYLGTNIRTKLLEGINPIIDFDQKVISKIDDTNIRADLSRNINTSGKLEVGLEASKKSFIPLSQSVEDIRGNTSSGDQSLASYQVSIYGQASTKIEKFNTEIRSGLNATYFSESRGISLDPRLIIHYQKPRWLLSASFQRLSQYLHLLSNSSNGYPADIWIPSFSDIPRQRSTQLWIGATYEMKPFDVSLGFYSRRYRDLINLREGLNLFGVEELTEKIVQGGIGKSDGMEVKIDFAGKSTSGWISYTLGRSIRLFKELNGGEWFRTPYSRDHNFSVVFNQKIGKKVTLGATFTAQSGYNITFPVSRYGLLLNDFADFFQSQNGVTTIYDVSKIFNFQTPWYHRLDVSTQFIKRTKRHERIWKLGIYNVYNRLNPYYFYLDRDRETGVPELFSIAIFPILPSFSYSLKW